MTGATWRHKYTHYATRAGHKLHDQAYNGCIEEYLPTCIYVLIKIRNRHSKLRLSLDHLAIVCLLLAGPAPDQSS